MQVRSETVYDGSGVWGAKGPVSHNWKRVTPTSSEGFPTFPPKHRPDLGPNISPEDSFYMGQTGDVRIPPFGQAPAKSLTVCFPHLHVRLHGRTRSRLRGKMKETQKGKKGKHLCLVWHCCKKCEKLRGHIPSALPLK